jgi:hypothetical protein
MNCASVSFSGGKFSLTKDLYVNSGLIGPFDSTSDVNVFLEDSIGNLITPTGSALVGNDLTITANIPNPNGVALQFPTPSEYTSFVTGDVGWRYQNGWFDYVPPTYPAKYAELDYTAGANSWFKLKTPLRVGGVLSTERFVDINGVQSWGILGNANVAVIDKLTGLMFTRGFATWGGNNYTTHNTNALAYSVVINGVTYSDWYLMSLREWSSVFGGFLLTANSWVDPISGLTITNTMTTLDSGCFLSDGCGSNSGANKVQFRFQLTGVDIFNGFQNDVRYAIRIHKAYNLISA